MSNQEEDRTALTDAQTPDPRKVWRRRNADATSAADGEHPSFTKAASLGKPTDNESFIEAFFVGEIGTPDIATVKRIVEEARIGNEMLERDCQDYVLEILEACDREAFLEEQDPD
ncbi:hypothetical protein BDV19DRAFT_391920 [Aspergillus venezuelensis]